MAGKKNATAIANYPPYIESLLSPDLPLDYHIIVGPSKKKFGVDKWMLIARSPQFRRMILESPLKQEKKLHLPDLDPVAFKHFLIYCYGHDHVATLPFNVLISMLTIAEVYDVPELKARLSETIKPQLNTDNVFVTLKNALICDKIDDLWKAITEVIQFDTKDVISNPEFRKASKDSILFIIQQDKLSVSEIDIWNAVLDWARNQGLSAKSPQNLRKIVLPMLKHVRLCSMTKIQLFDEVFPTGILNGEEVSLITASVSEQKVCGKLVEICNKLVSRSDPANVHIEFFDNNLNSLQKSCVTVTCYVDVKLCSVMFLAKERDSFQNSFYHCKGAITIQCVNNNSGISSPQGEGVRKIDFEKQVKYGGTFSVQGNNICLYANKSYRMSVTLTEGHKLFTCPKVINTQSTLNQQPAILSASIESNPASYSYNYRGQRSFGVHFKTIKFKTLHKNTNANTKKRKTDSM